MTEAWIQLVCPACEEAWESNPADLDGPHTRYECPHCGAERVLSEFMRTPRDLEILEEFQGAD